VLPSIVVAVGFTVFRSVHDFWIELGLTFLSNPVYWIIAAHVFVNYAIAVRTIGGVWATMDSEIEEAAEYVKENALAWYVSFEDEKKIDEINILQATQMSMHTSINEVRKIYSKKSRENDRVEKKDYNFSLLIDGNYFNPITSFNKETNKIETVPYITVEGGDNKYASIAAASILAKVYRDKYIEELCEHNPELSEHYGIDSNKGYGAKRHIDGIKEHGITIWHRRSFAPCKHYV
jgi:ribonuclease HII